jgi:hypothetical protein
LLPQEFCGRGKTILDLVLVSFVRLERQIEKRLSGGSNSRQIVHFYAGSDGIFAHAFGVE